MMEMSAISGPRKPRKRRNSEPYFYRRKYQRWNTNVNRYKKEAGDEVIVNKGTECVSQAVENHQPENSSNLTTPVISVNVELNAQNTDIVLEEQAMGTNTLDQRYVLGQGPSEDPEVSRLINYIVHSKTNLLRSSLLKEKERLKSADQELENKNKEIQKLKDDMKKLQEQHETEMMMSAESHQEAIIALRYRWQGEQNSKLEAQYREIRELKNEIDRLKGQREADKQQSKRSQENIIALQKNAEELRKESAKFQSKYEEAVTFLTRLMSADQAHQKIEGMAQLSKQKLSQEKSLTKKWMELQLTDRNDQLTKAEEEGTNRVAPISISIEDGPSRKIDINCAAQNQNSNNTLQAEIAAVRNNREEAALHLVEPSETDSYPQIIPHIMEEDEASCLLDENLEEKEEKEEGVSEIDMELGSEKVGADLNKELKTASEEMESLQEGNGGKDETTAKSFPKASPVINMKEIAGKRKRDERPVSKKTYYCAKCGKIYASKSGFDGHISSHDIPWRFPCDECGKRFHNERGLQRHIFSHETLERFECKVCRKPFKYQSTLNSHLCSPINTKPRLECEICRKQFNSRTSLWRHKRTHASEFPPM